MTTTNNLIKERVLVAQSILNVGLEAKFTAIMADESYAAEPLCSQYVDMKVGSDTFTIRISDHFAGKPAEKPELDTFKTSAAVVISCINLIAANKEKFVEIYDETGDFDEALKGIAK